MESIGERLKIERKRVGLSQEAMAKSAGVHRQTQVNYERGDRRPPVDYLDAAAKVGIDTEFVITGLRADEERVSLQAKSALLILLLEALGYRPADSQVQEALEIWTKPTPSQVASGGLEGFAGRLVGRSPTVAFLVAQARDIDPDLLLDVLQTLDVPSKSNGPDLPPTNRVRMATMLYRLAMSPDGRIDPRHVADLMALPE